MALAILDIDGTLVDTNYQHALAWYRAFKSCQIVLAVARIHRHIGMGGDQLVSALTDEDTEQRLGPQIRAAERSFYMCMIEEVEPMDGARQLIEDLKVRRHSVVLASSAEPDQVERYLTLLDARQLVDGWTSAGDVDATKPQPDLVLSALERVRAQPGEAVMIGDSPWDIEAADAAGVQALAVTTGGFATEELTRAGAVAVFESVAELRAGLDDTALR
jgi:HAD superfamily hydrolase (TIGR01509 family)